MRILAEEIIFIALVVFCVEATDPIRLFSSRRVDITLWLYYHSCLVFTRYLLSGGLEFVHDVVIDLTLSEHIKHIALVLRP